MLRKIASVSALVFAGSLTLAGTALAAPYDPVTVEADRGANGSYNILGTGFGDTGADSYVDISVKTSGGQTQTYRLSLNENGDFAGELPEIDNCSATVTVTGYPSGETSTSAIAGNDCSSSGTGAGGGSGSGGSGGGTGSGSGGSAGVGGTGYSSGGTSGGSYNGSGYSGDSYSSGNTAQGAYGSGVANTGAYGSGLAATGANIAAPVAVGVGTLLLGLGLLFFGTRGIVRRRG